MTAENRGTAARNRAQYFPMGPMEPAEVAVDEAIALGANDIGHLEERAESFFLKPPGSFNVIQVGDLQLVERIGNGLQMLG